MSTLVVHTDTLRLPIVGVQVERTAGLCWIASTIQFSAMSTSVMSVAKETSRFSGALCVEIASTYPRMNVILFPHLTAGGCKDVCSDK